MSRRIPFIKRVLLACTLMASLFCPLVSADAGRAPATTVAWDFDSISPKPKIDTSELAISEVRSVLIKMLDAWNMHDLDGYMDAYWKSPNLVFVSDAQLSFGWQELNDTYKRNFSDLDSMGKAIPSRIRIRMVRPELVLALTNWTLMLPKSTRTVSGVDTVFFEKFDFGWKIISSHTTTTDL
jgi:uncharacterized protein (TIGR02246 family)